MIGTIQQTEFAAIDFESAGVRPGGTDVPVQVGVGVMIGCSLRLDLGFQSLIASPEPVTWRARKVHGIADADLEGSPSMNELWPKFKAVLGGRWVVAHGASTEKRFLRAFPFHGFGPWVDTLKLSRAIDPDVSSHALGDLIGHHGLLVELSEAVPNLRWHDAWCDAVASLVLLRHFIRTLDLGGESPRILLRANDAPFHHRKAARRIL
ncbi:MAG: 3'-5' exonuclease [Terrimicrobiaceae bacterium]